jgi:multidrug efflux system membrane fusion protein
MRRRTLLRFFLSSLILLILATGSWILESRQDRPPASKSRAPAATAVSVAIAVARRGDMPVYLDGLGSVIAYNTVTVRSRVDGQLMRVFSDEGQYVNAGEPLAEIDPRPFHYSVKSRLDLLNQ